MIRFSNWSLRYKILIPLALIAIIQGLVVFFIYFSSYRYLKDVFLPRERVLNQFMSLSSTLMSETREYVLTFEEETIEELDELEEAVEHEMESLDNLFGSGEIHIKSGILDAAGKLNAQSDKIVQMRQTLDEQQDALKQSWHRIESLPIWLVEGPKNATSWKKSDYELALLNAKILHALEDYYLLTAHPLDADNHEDDDEENEELEVEPVSIRHGASPRVQYEALYQIASVEGKKLLEAFAPHMDPFLDLGRKTRHTRGELAESLEELEACENALEQELEKALDVTLAQNNQKLNRAAMNMQISLIIGLLAVITALFIVSDKTAERLKEVIRATSKFSIDNLNHRAPARGEDEPGRLARAFNDMADQLQKSIEAKEKTERTLLQQERLASREAGISEVSTAILHNVGNILNSVVTSCHLVSERVHSTAKHQALNRANQQLSNFDALLENKEAHAKLLAFYERYEKILRREYDCLVDHVDRISDKIEIIRKVIHSQQKMAGNYFQEELLDLHEVIEDGLLIFENDFANRGIEVRSLFSELPRIYVHRSNLTQVVINLLKNARDALGEQKTITLEMSRDKKFIYLKVSDTGKGIPKELLTSIFQYGFTTKHDGHGFGLHSCANSVQAMGGEIWAESEGEGRGATFVVRLPIKRKPALDEARSSASSPPDIISVKPKYATSSDPGGEAR
ncbi:MAG: ATP-binding protein [Acidobacteriota bacterium]|nr:ATP-binding protein [Acidobacteriota bacterium]